MTEDSCSYYQEKGKECGTYPTCKKSSSVSHSPGKKYQKLFISMLNVIKLSLSYNLLFVIWGFNAGNVSVSNEYKNKTKK